jgi:hypothetical protein
VRAEIAASDEPVSVLVQRYNITESTVRKWQARADFNDRSHTPHRLQTTLTPAQEAVGVELRRLLLLPLDDLVAVVKEFIEPKASRSAIHRCLRRHRVNKLRALRPEARQAAHKPLLADEPGFVHIDVKYLPQMPDETARRDLFVAIARATRWVFVQIKPHKTALGSGLPQGALEDLPHQDSQDSDRQRHGVHRSALWSRRAQRKRPA